MGEKRNIRLEISYDGRMYHGWQRQKNELTLQGVIEKKLEVMVGHRVTLYASGRTDAGVHAIGQVANFKTTSKISPEALRKGLNSLLPEDILVRKVEEAAPSFHSRYDARYKIYEYRILMSEEVDIFRRHYVWQIKFPLDMEKMKTCLGLLVGRHDFSSFRSAGSSNTNPVRTMTSAELSGPDKNGLVRLRFKADGFLRHMVRNIVGTVVEVGSGKTDVDKFKEIFLACDRRKAGIKAPPQGLFLIKVEY